MAPYAVLVPFALAIRGSVEPELARAVLVVAVAPAPLLGPALVTRLGGRSDTAGALLLGSVLASALLSIALLDVPGPVAIAAQAVALGAVVAAAAPRVRDALAVPLRWLGDLSLLALFALGLARGPVIDLTAVIYASIVVFFGIVAVIAVAAVAGVDHYAVLAGAGVRETGLAIALLDGRQATGFLLVYAALLYIGLATILAYYNWSRGRTAAWRRLRRP